MLLIVFFLLFKFTGNAKNLLDQYENFDGREHIFAPPDNKSVPKKNFRLIKENDKLLYIKDVILKKEFIPVPPVTEELLKNIQSPVSAKITKYQVIEGIEPSKKYKSIKCDYLSCMVINADGTILPNGYVTFKQKDNLACIKEVTRSPNSSKYKCYNKVSK